MPAPTFLRPRLPVWVTHSGNHYTVLWSEDTAAARVPDTPPVPPKAHAPQPAVSAGDAQPQVQPALDDPGEASRLPARETVAKQTAAEDADAALAAALAASASVTGDPELDAAIALSLAAATAAATSSSTSPGNEGAGAGAGSGQEGSGGSDHERPRDADDTEPFDGPHRFRFWHYNGLRPPRVVSIPQVRISSFQGALLGDWQPPRGTDSGDSSTLVDDPEEVDAETANKARKIKKILQHRVVSGGTKDGGPFELCIVCEKEGSMEPPQSGLELPPFWPARWYCRDCMSAKTPNYAGYNEEGAVECRACLRPAKECGWAHWVSLDQLPRATRDSWLRDHAPASLHVLRVRWPRAIADWEGRAPPPMFG